MKNVRRGNKLLFGLAIVLALTATTSAVSVYAYNETQKPFWAEEDARIQLTHDIAYTAQVIEQKVSSDNILPENTRNDFLTKVIQVKQSLYLFDGVLNDTLPVVKLNSLAFDLQQINNDFGDQLALVERQAQLKAAEATKPTKDKQPTTNTDTDIDVDETPAPIDPEPIYVAPTPDPVDPNIGKPIGGGDCDDGRCWGDGSGWEVAD